MMKRKLYPGILLLFCVAFFGCKKANLDSAVSSSISTGTRIYYVSDPNGNDNNTGTSSVAPFKTITKALPYVQPGDTVYLMTGTFNVTSTINITKGGLANKYITIKAMPGNTPVIYASGNNYNALIINASYIKFQNIEMKGDNANLTYAGALAAYNQAIATTPVTNGTYNTQAILIGGPNTQSLLPNHVEVSNCLVHDFPGGGIGAIQADYLTIQGNTVYNNCIYTIYAPSGISILNPVNSDAGDPKVYKNFVRNNKCFNNKTTIPWVNIKALSDGNGIIIDVNQYGYGLAPGGAGAYNGRTLVENNISVGNGGSGIHTFNADHVDIVNNTAYGNGVVVGYADIFSNGSSDNNIINNIMYSRTGGACNTLPRTTTTAVVYDYNVYFNGTIGSKGAHDLVGDPLFISPSTDVLLSNFQLTASSPAANSGSSTLFSAKDILGIARPKGSGVDRGAYESF